MNTQYKFPAWMAVALLLIPGIRARAADSAGSSSQGAGGGAFYSPQPSEVQEDLGDIRPAASAGVRSYFHFQATVNNEYTSNAPLFHSRDSADFLIMPAIEGDFSAPLDKHFKLDVTARIEDYTYASQQKLGFWGFSGDADLEYRYKPTWPRFFAGVEPYYYFSYETGTRLTAAIGPVAGVDQTLALNRGKTLLFAGYHFGQYYPFAGGLLQPSTYDLDEHQSHTVTISLTQQINPDLYAQFYWQGQYSIYSTARRDEMRNVEGLSLIHQINQNTFLSLSANYVDNASNNSLAKYTTVNVGLTLTLQF